MKGFKIRLSRTFLLIIGGVTVLGGGSGAAAVYIGADKLLGPSYASLNGLECTTVETVKIKKADRYWIRKYITTDGSPDGMSRLKTALRVARTVQQAEKPDLVQVTVLDAAGPTERAMRRGRAIGAQVVYIPDLSKAPEGVAAQPIKAFYIDGAPDAGEFWGLRIELPQEDAEYLSAKLTDNADCLEPIVEGGDGHASSGGHGADKGHGKAKGHAEPTGKGGGHGDGHGGGHGDGHGSEAAADGHGAPDTHGEHVPVAAEEGHEKPGLLASLMGMVGLGGEEPAVDAHEAGAHSSHEPTADAHLEPGAASPDASHGEPAQHAAPDHHAAKPEDGEAGSAPPATDWLDTIKGAVGLGTTTEDGAEAAVEPVADTGGAAHTGEAESSHDNVKEEHAPATDAKADDHGAAWLAKMRAQPLTEEGHSQAAAKEGSHVEAAAHADTAKNAPPQGAHAPDAAIEHGAIPSDAKASHAAVVAEEDDPDKHRKKTEHPGVTH